LGLKLRSFAESSLLRSTFLISRELGITFYDAAYVALTTDARLITADKDLYMKAKEHSVVKLLGETKPEELTVWTSMGKRRNSWYTWRPLNDDLPSQVRSGYKAIIGDFKHARYRVRLVKILRISSTRKLVSRPTIGTVHMILRSVPQYATTTN
jgi:hypothetical protein